MATQPPAPPKPGVYPGMSFDDYATLDAINFSILSKFADTPAHAYHGLLHKDEPTPTQRLGYLIHMALLEPERFEKSVATAPKLDRRTTAGKDAWRAFEAKNQGKELLKYEEMAACRGLQRAARNHASAKEILYGAGASELVFVWQDEEFGVLCKSRIDRIGMLGTQPVILDVKSTSDVASLRNFERSVGNYLYHEQGAMYLDGARTLRPLPEGERVFMWLVCETFEPYLVRLFQCEYEAIEVGYQLYRKHLAEFAKCKATGSWPAYPSGVETAGLPAWMTKTFAAQQ